MVTKGMVTKGMSGTDVWRVTLLRCVVCCCATLLCVLYDVSLRAVPLPCAVCRVPCAVTCKWTLFC